ncbi:MAG: hypothetical protein BAJALOKI2v1_550019 [Promethearchaeota archaeon]|nr:MAG: hypothetical protein BAJALOKI2v1_550019 [Candidatus Lokiarchaeota archaeon]
MEICRRVIFFILFFLKAILINQHKLSKTHINYFELINVEIIFNLIKDYNKSPMFI